MAWRKIALPPEVPPPVSCLLRAKLDMKAIRNDPPPGMVVVTDEEDLTVFHALLIGTEDTPYHGGFFYFVLRCPSDYPMSPPVVKLMTTGHGKVRFNPNLYSSGLVCLSILGTWEGPSWSPVQNIASVLISIQSLMNEMPYYNEPGIPKDKDEALRYNEYTRYEVLRVAVCDMVEGSTCDSHNCPQELRDAMEKHFVKFYDSYITDVKQNLGKKQGSDPLCGTKIHFDYEKILKRLEAIKKKLDSEKQDSDKPCSEAVVVDTNPGPTLSDDDFDLNESYFIDEVDDSDTDSDIRDTNAVPSSTDQC